jgi:putative ABC transport system permease protein
MKKLPPYLLLRFFQWYCRPTLRDHIEGDLIEEYNERLVTKGKRNADLKFTLDVLLLCRPTIIKSFTKHHPSNTLAMLKNYLLIGWRNLWKEKGYSMINIGGLAVGIAFALFIGLWIINEISYDSFHVNKDKIALVKKHTAFNDQKNSQDVTPYPLADELKSNYAEVNRASRMSFPTKLSLSANDETVNGACQFVEPDFLKMFSFPVLEGNAQTPLNDPLSIVLTKSFAKALFGNDNAVGKTVKIANRENLHVTAVIDDVPYNSSLDFDFLCSYERVVNNDDFIRNNRTNWSNNFLMTVVELKDGESMEAFSAKIRNLNMEKDATLKDQVLSLHPLSKWHLYYEFKNWENVGGKIEYVRLFGIVGIFVLVIACINFMNLSTARSQRRAKEVGIRKTMGSRRGQLILQFLSESILTVILSFVLASFLMSLCLPYMKELGFDRLNFNMGNSSWLIIGVIICVFTGLVAGSYPAFYLSSFSPTKVLKGVFKTSKNPITFRRVLVVLQFTISVALISSTIIVFEQIKHAKSRSIGYDPNNLISIEATDDLRKNFHVIKNELLATGYVEAVASASSPMTTVYNKWSDFSWEGKEPDSQIALEALMTEWDFEKVARLKFVLGRPFSIKYASDSNAVILNQSALKIIGYKDPIGKTMKTGNREVTIVGVVEDVLMLDPFSPVSGGVILFVPQVINTIHIRIKENSDVREAVAGIESIGRKHNAGQSISYSFVDQDFAQKFAMENQVAKLAGVFAVLAIFISGLGLIGLSSFVAEQRVKEIGIRKILGASISSLWKMLSKDFIVLVLISSVMASSIAWYVMNDWLLRYEYRTQISLWIFIATTMGALLITLVTVSFQALKVALVNPVQTLRSE